MEEGEPFRAAFEPNDKHPFVCPLSKLKSVLD